MGGLEFISGYKLYEAMKEFLCAADAARGFALSPLETGAQLVNILVELLQSALSEWVGQPATSHIYCNSEAARRAFLELGHFLFELHHLVGGLCLAAELFCHHGARQWKVPFGNGWQLTDLLKPTKLEPLHSPRRFPHLIMAPPLSAMPREQLWWWSPAEFNGVVKTAYSALGPEGGERSTMGWGRVRMEYFEGEV